MPAELDRIWEHFLNLLHADPALAKVRKVVIAGTPFLYVFKSSLITCSALQTRIEKTAKKAMLFKRVTSKTVFVRAEDDLFVFRHRFYVPQEKMFCCGNRCTDCILLQPKRR
ncbi:hypothetical protein CEF21_11190 [Bacillus sp. FJAT-42376]|nr:hypothetical protein CEF21_11190 [Bacillus sp. FJAT-42376]